LINPRRNHHHDRVLSTPTNSQAVDMWTMRPDHEGALRAPCAPATALRAAPFDHMPTAIDDDLKDPNP